MPPTMSAQMSPALQPAATLPAAIHETILNHLAPLFLAGAAGDIAAARQAAAQTLAAYDAQTEDELRLAANIVGFSFQALEALGQAAMPGTPPTRTLRLRGSAVSLSRESHKAERRLTQLQKARRQGRPAQPADKSPQPEPKTQAARPTIDDPRKAAKASGQTWTQAYEQRQREARIAASLRRAEARVATTIALQGAAKPPSIAESVSI